MLLAFLFGCSSGKETNSQTSKAQMVNPFIGTGGHGHTYPGASSPFGFVQLSPDSRLDGWDGCGGYHYSDSVIYGFSHTHLSGTGVSDYGDVLFMPMTGEPTFENGSETSYEEGYASHFSHSNEKAEAGYYQVFLDSYGINAELTTTKRCGFHKYTFDKSNERSIILDLQHRDRLLEHSIEIIDNKIIKGKRISKAWAEKQYIYFYAELSDPVNGYNYNEDSTKVILKLKEGKETLLKIGLSAVSIEGAKNNLSTEIPHWEFETIKAENQAKWNKELSKIEVEMMSEEDNTIFYTALYHAYLNPNTFNDIDGKYRGTDLQVHQTEGFNNYTIFSLWDTYRAEHPLFVITQQQKTLDFINTFLNQYKNGGKLPVWELAGNYTGCMIGYHSIPVIVDAYQKGITNFDTELALEAMIKTASTHELGKEFYAKNGYMASNEEHESVSKNLEYAYDDWCIAQFAKALGKMDIYKEYIMRAQNYKNIFDPNTGFMRAKRNQQFTIPFNPTEVNFNFTEANSWQYSFYTPQDVTGLINLHEGAKNFDEKLDLLFSAEEETSGREQVDITGLKGQYAHGNEPSHHMAYLYSYISKPWKTQKLVRELLTEMYTDKPDGLIGNEDCGQMSAWYIFSALGFYPVTPGSTDYIIGSPNIKSAKINLENEKVFEIVVHNQSKENVYIKSIKLNGNEYSKSFISHQDIINGGKLEFEMSVEPNSTWEHTPPVSTIEEHQITPVPYLKTRNQVFFETLDLEISCIDKEAKIYYTLDNSEPTENSTLYEGQITIEDSKNLKAIAISEGKAPSKIAHSEFFKVKKQRNVHYKSLYNSQYAGGGELGLVDYIRGGDDYRNGAWQGWQGKDVELIVNLNEEQTISKISAGFIQDIRSWIFMPKNIKFFISKDGKDYQLVSDINPTVPDNKYGSIVQEYGGNIKPTKASYVRLVVRYYGIIPEWHLGAGGESWTFIDEIVIE